jgi:hypothetical protein
LYDLNEVIFGSPAFGVVQSSAEEGNTFCES